MSAETPVVLYDTTLRDGTQGEGVTLSLADKIRVARRARRARRATTSRAAGPARTPRTSSSSRRPHDALQQARLAAFGSTRHRSNKPEDDRNLRELVDAETPVVTIFGKSWDCST